MVPHEDLSPARDSKPAVRFRPVSRICVRGCVGRVFSLAQARAQDDQLNKVHVEPPSAPSSAPASEPKGAEAAPDTGAAALHIHPGSFIRMNVDMVLVPVTITDPLNRLVTGLEKEDFQVYENNGEQPIASFASEDAPVSIGIIFDLSGSMTVQAGSRPRGDSAVHQDRQSAGRILRHRIQRPAGAD